jgi:NAD(P)-dependent dehydrogenase (short-subunit alcohol dehydrogenase family)
MNGEVPTGKVLVTGGSSGIGLATARLLRQRGVRVAVLDRQPLLDASLDACIVRADVLDAASVQRAVAAAADRLGGLDGLVNSAGIGAVGTVEEGDLADWQRVLDVNLLGIVRVTRAALPFLRGGVAPSIVNVSSVAATVGLRDRALYSASKGAVAALTRAMAADLVGEGIRVNSVSPGTADTPWVTRLVAQADDPDAVLDALRRRQPHGRLVTATEVAEGIAYLLGAGSTTGTSLEIDGGLTRLRVLASGASRA